MSIRFWQSLPLPARIGLAAGAVLVVAATAALAAWLLRTERDVLFAQLSTQDAAAMTAELDRMKVPYELAADGTSILVARGAVAHTRLKLMSADLPLHGAVGFELFNHADFGMTEFAQKVNYQRALQGEIARTLLSLAEVQSARVHLALPEDGLFRRERSPGKALITLSMKRGLSLRAEQVTGIQRLVSAAVAGIAAQDVTIVDARGVALTHAVHGDGTPAGSAPLELKVEIERHLSRKVAALLDGMFGAGRALASVDVSLDMSVVRVTTEDVTGPAARRGQPATGVIVRERETVRDEPGAGGARDAEGAWASSQRETEYQVGRRVQQVTSQPGSVQRVHVLAVIDAPLEPRQLQQVQSLVGAAVGASRERGDTVVVQSMGAIHRGGSGPAQAVAVAARADDIGGILAEAPPVRPAPVRVAAREAATDGAPVVLALAAASMGLLGWSAGRRRAGRGPSRDALTARQRELALQQLRHWVQEGRTRPSGRPT